MRVEAKTTRDRMRGPRRRASDETAPSDPVAEFKAFVDAHLQRLEQAAAIAAGEIEVEAERVRGLAPADADLVSGLGTALAGATATAAEEFARLRAEITGPGRLNGSPSEGTVMIIRQMAVAGAETREIEARLASLGIKESREAIERILGVERK
jgi:hypothetical protein